jgi:N4-(beta-N-acetylglucosaminyl)-L-asparaginase
VQPTSPLCLTFSLSLETKAGEVNKASANNHDTIGMIAIDDQNNIAVGTSTNGMNHKIPG